MFLSICILNEADVSKPFEFKCLSTLVVFWFRNNATCKKLGGCICSSSRVLRAYQLACVCSDVGCVTGVAGAGAAAVADERPVLAAIVLLQPPQVFLF